MKKALLSFLSLSLCAASYAQTPLYDPFYRAAKVKKSSSSALLPLPPIVPLIEPINVTAVMNGKAFINGKWVGVGERIRNQEVSFIQHDFVGLKEGNRLTMYGVGNQRRVLSTKETQ